MSDLTPKQAAAEVERCLQTIPLRLHREMCVLIDHARDEHEWFPKVLVTTDESWHRGRRGSSVDWGRADIVVTPDGTVLKNKYGPTGWTDWKS